MVEEVLWGADGLGIKVAELEHMKDKLSMLASLHPLCLGKTEDGPCGHELTPVLIDFPQDLFTYTCFRGHVQEYRLRENVLEPVVKPKY